MNKSDFLENETVKGLVNEIVETLIRRYRIDSAVAKKNAEDVFAGSKNLQKVLEKETQPEKVKRTRAYKDAVAAIKRNTYYGLRRYSGENTGQNELIEQLASLKGAANEEVEELARRVAATHASTKERLGDAAEFYRQLFDLIGSPKNILDVGGGMQSLIFPFERLAADFKLFLAVDKDSVSIAAVNAFAGAKAEKRLIGVKWDIKEGWDALLKYNDSNDFDVAFLFKLIPVVERQQPAYLNILKNTPAKRLVITGSKMSLTKNQSIEKRERKTILRFIKSADLRVIGEISVSEEFGFVVERE